MKKTGVLLLNLGTPDYCNTWSIWRYLHEFLLDPRVIDLPWLARWLLVNLLIIPFRIRKVVNAYRKIWGKTGSPLLINSHKLQQALALSLGPDYQVEIAMRYGYPSIPHILAKMASCQEIKVVPLFPQYTSAATGSASAKVFTTLAKQWNIPALHMIRDFYHDPGFIEAYATLIQETLRNQTIDLILFSYHGLPERHISKSECKASCDHAQACPSMSTLNAYCYRAQCYATSKLIAEKLSLPPQAYQVAFQSRLGRTPWIKPYTDVLLPALLQQGIKNIAIVCPSFTADCLETLEEVDIRTRLQWQQLGGENFVFIPCLNDHPRWVSALAQMIAKFPL